MNEHENLGNDANGEATSGLNREGESTDGSSRGGLPGMCFYRTAIRPDCLGASFDECICKTSVGPVTDPQKNKRIMMQRKPCNIGWIDFKGRSSRKDDMCA